MRPRHLTPARLTLVAALPIALLAALPATAYAAAPEAATTTQALLEIATSAVWAGMSWVLGMVDALLSPLLGAAPEATDPMSPADALIARLPDLALVLLLAASAFGIVRARQATERRRLELAARMVERGLEPPSLLFGAEPRADLRRGLVLVSLGVGLFVASVMVGRPDASPLGLIPAFIGLGYLLSHSFTRAEIEGEGPAHGRPPRQPKDGAPRSAHAPGDWATRARLDLSDDADGRLG